MPGAQLGSFYLRLLMLTYIQANMPKGKLADVQLNYTLEEMLYNITGLRKNDVVFKKWVDDEMHLLFHSRVVDSTAICLKQKMLPGEKKKFILQFSDESVTTLSDQVLREINELRQVQIKRAIDQIEQKHWGY